MMLRSFDFGNEAGDDASPQELAAYFVEQPLFAENIDRRNRLLITTAKKGVGKSALLKRLADAIKTRDTTALVVRCRGSDLARDAFGLTAQLVGPGDHIRDWMVRLCALVNREIAKTIGLALTDDEITLVESAELDGFKQKNLVGCLVSRFERGLDKLAPKKEPVRNQIEALKRAKNPHVYVLIDDLDATFQNTPQECLQLSTFFSACRYIVLD